MVDRTGQVWAYNYTRLFGGGTAFYLVLHSDQTLKQHHVIAFYDTDGSSPYDNKIYEVRCLWEEWSDVYRIA